MLGAPVAAVLAVIGVRGEVLLTGSAATTAIALLAGTMAGVAAISGALALIAYAETSDRRVLLMAAAYLSFAGLFAVFVQTVVTDPGADAVSDFARAIFAAVMLAAVTITAGARRPVPPRRMVAVTLLLVVGALLIAGFAAAFPGATTDAFRKVPGGIELGGNGAALVFSALAALATWQAYRRNPVPIVQHVAIGMTMMAVAGVAFMFNPAPQTTMWWLGYAVVAAAGLAMGGGLLRIYAAMRPPSSIYDLEVMPIVVDAAVSSGDAVLLVDPDARVRSTSADTPNEIFGPKPVGKNLSELPGGKAWTQVWESGRPQHISVDTDGDEQVLRVTPMPLASPGDGAILLVRDVTAQLRQREQAELLTEELERSQAALDLRAQSLEAAYEDVLRGLGAVVTAGERRDEYHPSHHRELAELGERVAKQVGLTGAALRQVREASMLYDIGKLAVPDRVLRVGGPLSAEEWKQLHEVPVITERILHQTNFLRGASKVARHVHERFDGAGYPDGLAGEQIPLGARVVCACASFLAMTNDRPYRAALAADAAIAEILSGAGAQFCPTAAQALADVLRVQPKAPEQQDYPGNGKPGDTEEKPLTGLSR